MKAAIRLPLFCTALAVIIAVPGAGCRTKRPDKGITVIRTGPTGNIAQPGPIGPGVASNAITPATEPATATPIAPPIPIEPITPPQPPKLVQPLDEGALPPIGDLFGMVPDKNAFAPNTVRFDYDSAALKAKELPKLKEVAVVLRNSPGCKVVVDGHCDERGTEEYNRALGERRALKVREQLIKEGISSDRIYTRTYGKDVPAALGHDEASWTQNRRGEFILLRPPGGAGARTP
jgi:peptidoglycan-associated lipoprotein